MRYIGRERDMQANQARRLGWGESRACMYERGEMEKISYYLEPPDVVTYRLGWGKWIGKSEKYEGGEERIESESATSSATSSVTG